MCELSPIPFHGDTIFCVEYNGQPFAPMRPLVENMGMDWASQSTKLNANKARWSVAIIATVAQDGKERETLCLPVRKLPAFLASINPKKVRPELREKIELYQAECDDALWAYWTEGRAERQPQPEAAPLPLADAPITPDQQCTLKSIVKGKVEGIPEAERPKGLYPQIWSRFNNHFRLGSYKQLPQCRLSEAIEYLMQMDLTPQPKELPAALPAASAPRTPLEALMQLGSMPYDPSPISHLYEEDRELDTIFKALRGYELKLDSMSRNNQLPPVPKGRKDDAARIRQTFLASCYVARQSLSALYELGRDARMEQRQQQKCLAGV